MDIPWNDLDLSWNDLDLAWKDLDLAWTGTPLEPSQNWHLRSQAWAVVDFDSISIRYTHANDLSDPWRLRQLQTS